MVESVFLSISFEIRVRSLAHMVLILWRIIRSKLGNRRRHNQEVFIAHLPKLREHRYTNARVPLNLVNQ